MIVLALLLVAATSAAAQTAPADLAPEGPSAPAARPADGDPAAATAPAAEDGRGHEPAVDDDCAPTLDAQEGAVAADPESRRLASEYRQTIIRCADYDRSIAFFAQLVVAHPDSANAYLNYGYAYVDKIPAAGSISRVILANHALKQFTRSIELKRTWLALYTRGNSYLFWPRIFGRGPLAVADLVEAVEMSRHLPDRRVYARAYAALGDAYWRTDQPDRARAIWQEGLQRFPGDEAISARMARDGDELDRYLYDQLDPNLRVDTDLSPLWKP